MVGSRAPAGRRDVGPKGAFFPSRSGFAAIVRAVGANTSRRVSIRKCRARSETAGDCGLSEVHSASTAGWDKRSQVDGGIRVIIEGDSTGHAVRCPRSRAPRRVGSPCKSPRTTPRRRPRPHPLCRWMASWRCRNRPPIPRAIARPVTMAWPCCKRLLRCSMRHWPVMARGRVGAASGDTGASHAAGRRSGVGFDHPGYCVTGSGELARRFL